MHKMMIAGAVLALGGASALAQDDYQSYETGQPEAGAEMSVDDAFAAMDTDADGSVTQEEFTAYAGEGSETQFSTAAGDDGVLTKDELSAFVVTPNEAVGGDM